MALQLLVASVALLVVCGLCPTLISAAPGFLDAAGHRQLLQAPADGGSGDGPQLTVQAGQVPQVPVPGTDASGMERQSVFAAAPVPFNIWLYSLIPVQRTSATLLRQWVRHYHYLGVARERFLLLLHHDPTAAGAEGAHQAAAHLATLQTALDDLGLNYRLWIGEYGCWRSLELELRVLAEESIAAEDWVLLAAPDEFQLYVTHTVRPLLKTLERRGQNFVLGLLEDRAAPGGELTEVTEIPSIFEQFPLQCSPAVDISTRGATAKIAAFKGYLRPDAGNLRVVEPAAANEYFGPAQTSGAHMHGDCQKNEADLFPLTPYVKWENRYLHNASQLQQPGGEQLWVPHPGSYVSLVQRFQRQGDPDAAKGEGMGGEVAAPLVGNESQREDKLILAARQSQLRAGAEIMGGRQSNLDCHSRVHNPRYIHYKTGSAAAKSSTLAKRTRAFVLGADAWEVTKPH